MHSRTVVFLSLTLPPFLPCPCTFSSPALPLTNQTFQCYCNQFNTVGCVRTNNTVGGECSATSDRQSCLATWERSPAGGLIIAQYFCSDDNEILSLKCLWNGGTAITRNVQFPIVTVCCKSEYCNSPTRLQAVVETSVRGIYIYIHIYIYILLTNNCIQHSC